MNFARPITPATTGPVSIPIRTCSTVPASAATPASAGAIASAVSAIASA